MLDLIAAILRGIQIRGGPMIPNKSHLYNKRFGNSSFINVLL